MIVAPMGSLAGAGAVAFGQGARESLLAALAVERLVRPLQVHGAAVAELHGSWPDPAPAADVVFTRIPGVAVAIVTADCVPLLLRGPGAAMAAHVGWRGAGAGVVAAAIGALLETGGDARDIVAFLGPCAGACCYEVGDEVVAALLGAGAERTSAAWRRPGRDDRHQVDLHAWVVAELRARGVRDAAIEVLRECTICHDRGWPSYRREGRAGGRIWSAVAWRGF